MDGIPKPGAMVSSPDFQLDAPLFVLGSPRSGTSLLRLMLTSHPQLVIPPECGFILWLAPEFGAWDERSCDDGAIRGRFLSALGAARKFNTWGLSTAAVDDEIRAVRPKTYAELCAAVVRAYRRKQEKSASIWGDKNNYYVRHVAELFALYPRGRFLHIVRDVRDVACSYREVMEADFSSPFSPNLPTDIDAIADVWTKDVSRLVSDFEHIPQARKATIRYEDVVADPARVLDGICRWLSVPYCDEMLDFHARNRARGLEPEETMGWKAKTLLPIDRESVGRYRQRLSRTEADQLARRAAPWLERLGYGEP